VSLIKKRIPTLPEDLRAFMEHFSYALALLREYQAKRVEDITTDEEIKEYKILKEAMDILIKIRG